MNTDLKEQKRINFYRCKSVPHRWQKLSSHFGANMKSLLILLSLVSIAVADDTKKKVERPPIVSCKEWGSEPQPIPDSRKHTPKYITIHHAGVDYKPTTDPAKFVKNMQ